MTPPSHANAATRIAVRDVDEKLPQLQCARCGYPRCVDYARAVFANEAAINRCPPGGDVTLTALATLTGVSVPELDPTLAPYPGREAARIIEHECIGCALCLDACPVDAIVGARHYLHTVVTAECTGCGLCLPPCPMDCIVLEPTRPASDGNTWPEFDDSEVRRFRERAQRHGLRPARADRQRYHSRRTQTKADRRLEIDAAVARVRARRATGEHG